ncbi:MAG TPA: cysteine desulfurase [Candidatus Polarisedimenticolia bacterium]|nr:cysteine desulfurase [Candidatus Polarisedimenticolia bacterium]
MSPAHDRLAAGRGPAAVRPAGAAVGFDVEAVRRDFPILATEVHGKPLVYLDNAATSQKPRAVIDALTDYYTTMNSNVHRGLHDLSERATAAYEGSRAAARRFLNAGEDREVIFVRGTTEGINLVAQAWGRTFLKAGDEILITEMEHHSNIVPWQLVAGQTGAVLKVAPITDGGVLRLDALGDLLGGRTKIVAMAHVSNALGTVNPVATVAKMAHERGALLLVDGAQAAPHLPIDVRALDADFYAFSPHKAFGPTGIGVIYGKAALLESMPPWQGGGDMISSVSFEKTTYNRLPWKFEAGTPDIAGAVGLGAAIAYLDRLDRTALEAHERDLLEYASARLRAEPGVTVLAADAPRVGVASFTLDGVHPHDVGTILDMEGIAVRAGHHCAQPLMDRLGVHATARASVAFYNTRAEIDALVAGLARVREVFGR